MENTVMDCYKNNASECCILLIAVSWWLLHICIVTFSLYTVRFLGYLELTFSLVYYIQTWETFA